MFDCQKRTLLSPSTSSLSLETLVLEFISGFESLLSRLSFIFESRVGLGVVRVTQGGVASIVETWVG